jgi:hypothetical protein
MLGWLLGGVGHSLGSGTLTGKLHFMQLLHSVGWRENTSM